jgi:hypothetical protein
LLTNRNDYSHGVFHLTRKKLKNKQMKNVILYSVIETACCRDYELNLVILETYITVVIPVLIVKTKGYLLFEPSYNGIILVSKRLMQNECSSWS